MEGRWRSEVDILGDEWKWHKVINGRIFGVGSDEIKVMGGTKYQEDTIYHEFFNPPHPPWRRKVELGGGPKTFPRH